MASSVLAPAVLTTAASVDSKSSLLRPARAGTFGEASAPLSVSDADMSACLAASLLFLDVAPLLLEASVLLVSNSSAGPALLFSAFVVSLFSK